MPAVKRRHSGGREDSLLHLTQGYTRNPEAFARPGPLPEPPLPLKFTCNACGGEVKVHEDEGYGTCRGCPAIYDF